MKRLHRQNSAEKNIWQKYPNIVKNKDRAKKIMMWSNNEAWLGLDSKPAGLFFDFLLRLRSEEEEKVEQEDDQVENHEENERFLSARCLEAGTEVRSGGGTLLLPGEKFPHFICRREERQLDWPGLDWATQLFQTCRPKLCQNLQVASLTDWLTDSNSDCQLSGLQQL